MNRDPEDSQSPTERLVLSENERIATQSSHPPLQKTEESQPSDPYAIYHDAELRALRHADELQKYKIRMLRLVLRAITFVISILVLVPIAMTVTKFLATRNSRRTIVSANNVPVTRGPWAKDTKAWPAYLYLTISSLSTLLDGIVLLSYLQSVKAANRAAMVAQYYAYSVVLGHLTVWIVGVIIYRTEKDLNGISNDLWGWSCSFAAQEIQKAFDDEVNFHKYCNVQSYSWYAGLVQVGSSILSMIIFFFAYRRKDNKKIMQKRATWLSEAPEGLASPQQPDFSRVEQDEEKQNETP